MIDASGSRGPRQQSQIEEETPRDIFGRNQRQQSLNLMG